MQYMGIHVAGKFKGKKDRKRKTTKEKGQKKEMKMKKAFLSTKLVQERPI